MQSKRRNTRSNGPKYIFVTGGVMSGLGKGVIAASTAKLLQLAGVKVSCVKIDPYVNYDAGTMNPVAHGEVFVTKDGGECDMDLGNYERFLDVAMTREHNITTGRIYLDVIQLERQGKYLGQCVQIIPHITDNIKDKGVFEASSYVVGTSLKALELVMEKREGVLHAFNPIGGLHHAKRGSAGGFCVFNDIGIISVIARKKYRIEKIAYVDIDAHHGDGVYYEFEDDPTLYIADIHEDGHFLYPGTGAESENGSGDAKGTKLNIPLKPKSDDADFFSAFNRVEEFIDMIAKPELIILQCGADCINGDPLTHLRFSSAAHRYASEKLHRLSHKHSDGRMIALGGGGYNQVNLAEAWTEVVRSFVGGSV